MPILFFLQLNYRRPIFLSKWEWGEANTNSFRAPRKVVFLLPWASLCSPPEQGSAWKSHSLCGRCTHHAGLAQGLEVGVLTVKYTAALSTTRLQRQGSFFLT